MTDLLAQFADPQTMQAMSTLDKLIAGLFTTVLGMGITFLALVILQCIISLLNRLVNIRQPVPPAAITPPQAPAKASTMPAVPAMPMPTGAAENNEVIAAIVAAIGLMTDIDGDRVAITRIVRASDRASIWSQTGILEQMSQHGRSR
ncbi:MAG: OadG family protein [Desulfopila sp.]